MKDVFFFPLLYVIGYSDPEKEGFDQDLNSGNLAVLELEPQLSDQ